MTDTQERAVALVPQRGIVRAGGSPQDVIEAFGEYQKIQQALDRALPDCIMEIQNRKFRKKNYWRAIATAFNLDVTCEREERSENGSDWGYVVTYRATAPNGRSTTGDGACFASEKVVYQKEWFDTQRGRRSKRKLGPDGKSLIDEIATSENQSIHNVRGHAHTRAFNRAVSNLVGFGEVSAEEIGRMHEEDDASSEPRDVTPRASRKAAANVISEAQAKRFYAMVRGAADGAGWPERDSTKAVKSYLASHGFDSSREITRDRYDAIIEGAMALFHSEPAQGADAYIDAQADVEFDQDEAADSPPQGR